MERSVDEKDLVILDALKERGDSTVRQIAKKTLLPATTIHNRIAKLRKAGVIKKFTIEVDPKKLGLNIGAYLLISADLKLLKERKRTQYDLARELRKIGRVERVSIVTGGTDLVARLRVKDVDELDKILLGKIQLLEGVAKTQTMIIIRD